jgi:hypothetical protein
MRVDNPAQTASSEKLWTSRDRSKYKKQQQMVRRAQEEQRRLLQQIAQSPGSSDDDATSDPDDGLGYTLPNLPVYLSDAEGTTDGDMPPPPYYQQGAAQQQPQQTLLQNQYQQPQQYTPGQYPPPQYGMAHPDPRNAIPPGQYMGSGYHPSGGYPSAPYPPFHGSNSAYPPPQQQQMLAAQYASAWAAAVGVPYPYSPYRSQFQPNPSAVRRHSTVTKPDSSTETAQEGPTSFNPPPVVATVPVDPSLLQNMDTVSLNDR